MANKNNSKNGKNGKPYRSGSNGNSKNQGGNSNFKPKKQGMQEDVMGTPYRNPLNKDDSTKQQRRGEEAADTDAKMSRGNPIQFYTKFDTFVKDAANLPFAMPVGSRFEIYDYPGENDNSVNNAAPYYYSSPGVMTLEFVPAIGVSDDFSSPINRSSIRFYTYLRSNQKASASYDHQDISMMELALDSCYMYHGLMSKVYSVVNLFTPANEYYSRAILLALGVDFDDIRKNLQDFRAYINAYAYSLGQYALPSNIELFNRHRWMVEGLYTDGETTKAQTYMFVPGVFFQYDNTVSTGSQCIPKYWFPDFEYKVGASDNGINPSKRTPKTFAQIKAFGDSLLNAVSNEEDFAVISGDIYNFYGGDTYKLPYITENYAVLPTYNKTVLSQIENATVVGQLQRLTVSQNPKVNQGAIIFHPYPASHAGSTQCFMNFHWDRPTPEDVIEASRLITVTRDDANDNPTIKYCGTEIVCSLSVATYTYSDSGVRQLENVLLMNHQLARSNTEASEATYMKEVLTLAQFDWAPCMRVYHQTGGTGKFKWEGWTWDVDNVDTIPDEYIANIHLGCLLSLFSVETNRG